jgi:large subunit ribosomal protein L19
MNKIIQELNGERATRKLPEFNPGDTVVVQVKVVEGDRERVQAYEGVVIAKKNARFHMARASSACFKRIARPSARSA